MIVLMVISLCAQAFTLACVLSLTEARKRKTKNVRKTEGRELSEKEARRILADLANDIAIFPEETAAIDAALARQWCYLDGPCEYGNAEIKLPEEELKAVYESTEEELMDYLEKGQRYKQEEGAGNDKIQ